MMKSIHGRLALGFLLALPLALIVCGAFMQAWFRSALEDEFRAGLSTRAEALLSLVENDADGLEFDFNPAMMPEYAADSRSACFVIRNEAGVVFFASPNYESAWSEAGNGFEYAIVERSIEQHDREPDEVEMLPILLEAVVMRDRAPLDSTLAGLRRGLVIAGVSLCLLTILMGWWVLQRGMRPLHALAGSVRDFRPEMLGQSVVRGPQPTELEPIVEALDDMSKRLGKAFEREREMTGNVAHELRTPVADLRTASDLVKEWPEDEEIRAACIEAASRTARRMEQLVETLLRFSRLRAGQGEDFGKGSCDPAALLESVWSELAERAEERGLRRRHERSSAVQGEVMVAPELLEIALRNLLSNAIEHAAAPGEIVTRHTAEGEQTTLTIENPIEHGPGKGEAERLTEAFWRGDAARSGENHAGLGLAIVKQIADHSGGGLELDWTDERFVAGLSLPRRAESS